MLKQYQLHQRVTSITADTSGTIKLVFSEKMNAGTLTAGTILF